MSVPGQVCIECRMSAVCLMGLDVMSVPVIVMWSVKVSGFLWVQGHGQDPACRRTPEHQPCSCIRADRRGWEG